MTYNEALEQAMGMEWEVAMFEGDPYVETKEKIEHGASNSTIEICVCNSPALAELIVREHNEGLRKK